LARSASAASITSLSPPTSLRYNPLPATPLAAFDHYHLPLSAPCSDDFQQLNIIGRGAFREVRLCREHRPSQLPPTQHHCSKAHPHAICCPLAPLR
jgi:hypothetical protein